MVNSSNIDRQFAQGKFPGSPDCPICNGFGFYRKDVPIGDPEYGKLFPCSCLVQQSRQAENRQLLIASNLDAYQNYTFQSFKPGGRVGMAPEQVTSLTSAYNHALHYAQNLKGWLLLTGNYGCGKTHLAAAIANYAVEIGVPTLFQTVPDLLDWARAAYHSMDTSFEERFDKIRNVHLLILDDLGAENETPWAQEKLFQIINHRYVHRLPTVFTSNLELGNIEERIWSRLQDPELVLHVKIIAPDYRSPMRDTTQSQLSSLHHYSAYTFGNFSLREREHLPAEEQKSLEKTFQAARDFAENPSGWLLFMGSYGCGKTHLAAAIGNYQVSTGASPLFVVVPELLDHLRSTFNPNSNQTFDSLFQQVRSSPLLILDDLGTHSATPWAREKLYQIFNFRYITMLPTVITTSSRMEDLDERIRSRMLDKRVCRMFAILAPAFRTTETPEKAKKRPRPLP